VAYPETTDTVTDNSATTGLWNLGSHANCVLYAYEYGTGRAWRPSTSARPP
jgi:hypothetical protein